MHLADLSPGYGGNAPDSPSDTGPSVGERTGSDTPFSELHRLYAHRLYRTIFSITKNREDAEDVLQETFFKAYLAIDSFEGRSKLFSWLTRIAINTSLMSLRKRHVRHRARVDSLSFNEDEAGELQISDTRPNPEESCLQREKRLRIASAMAALKPALRSVLQVQVSGGLSLKEIAGTLDVSVATVKARLHRARKRLVQRVESDAAMRESRTRTSSR